MLRAAVILSLLATGHCIVTNSATRADGEWDLPWAQTEKTDKADKTEKSGKTDSSKKSPMKQSLPESMESLPLFKSGLRMMPNNKLQSMDDIIGCPKCWESLKTYKAKAVCEANHHRFQVPDKETGVWNMKHPLHMCADMGKNYPTLVTSDDDQLRKYEDFVCSQFQTRKKLSLASGAVEMAPAITDVAASMATAKNGCFHAAEDKETGATLAWNTTHIVRFIEHAKLTDPAKKVQQLNELMKSVQNVVNVSYDLIVVPSNMDFAYQKVLMDFIPQVYSTFEYARQKNAKFLVRTKMQQKLLKKMGVPDHHIHDDTMKTHHTICVDKDASLHLLRIKGNTKRQLNHRIGSQIAQTVLNVEKHKIKKSYVSSMNQTLEEQLEAISNVKPVVVFAKRCGSKALPNEQDAVEVVRKVMQQQGRDEELISFCPEELSFLEVVQYMSRAKVVIGAHGSSLANLLFATPGCNTHVIEIVGGTQHARENGLTPYDSYYKGGVGAPFSYKLVLHRAGKKGNLVMPYGTKAKGEKTRKEDAAKQYIDLPDFHLALTQIWKDGIHSEI